MQGPDDFAPTGPDSRATGLQETAGQLLLIGKKLTAPTLSVNVVPRPRLEGLLAELIGSHHVLVLSATAGAGKTTAVAQGLGSLDHPVAWLTLDRTDALPGRLLTYLEAALARFRPEVRGVATGAVAAGIPHAEAAGMLADAVGGTRITLVLDEFEKIEHSADACAVIAALLRYAPAGMGFVLLSRRDLPSALGLPLAGLDVAWVRDEDLNFTVEEAEKALARSGAGEDIDAASAVETTGGWVAGVQFEVWRASGHASGTGGEADPLHGYLAAHVLDQLTAEDRAFLVRTSLLDEVTAPRAEALGQIEAGSRLLRLRAAHLPATWHPEHLGMRCHLRFREYLMERLEHHGGEEARGIHLAYGRLLESESFHEDATEEFLRARELGEAFRSAERVIEEVIERADFPIAERWLEELGDFAPTEASGFTAARVMLAVARNDYHRAVEIADELFERGERAKVASSSGRQAALMAWCYLAAGRQDDYYQVIEHAKPGPEIDRVRYVANHVVTSGKATKPEPASGPLAWVVPTVDYLSGNFSELIEMSGSQWGQAIARPWQIAALRATGQTRRALEMYEDVRHVEAGGPSFLQAFIGPEVLIDAGRIEEGREELIRTRELARRISPWAWVINRFAEARLNLRTDRDPTSAREILERVEPTARQAILYSEIHDSLYAFALLLEGEVEGAVHLLRSTVESMQVGERILELPAAAVYLAEAEWRAGDEDAAIAAADQALAAAQAQRSNHLLLQALADFPSVASLRIEAEPEVDSEWHRLGRALVAQGVSLTASVGRLLELEEFGQIRLQIDGEELRPKISKSYELLAYLAGRRPQSVERAELFDVLFEGRADDSTRAYLRQAVRWLREALPSEDAFVVTPLRIHLTEQVALTTDSARFEAQLAEAARLQGEERLRATLEALAIFEKGDYLPGLTSTWVEERRRELVERAFDARQEAAQLAFDLGRVREAGALNAEVLGADVYREGAWRLGMRIANALGDENGVIRSYRGCEQALANVGAQPSGATRALFGSLRR